MTPNTVLSIQNDEDVARHKASGVLLDDEATDSAPRSLGAAPALLKAGGIFADWPHGRGSYVSSDGVVIVQVGGENHIRVICETNSSDEVSAEAKDATDGKQIGAVFRRLKATLDNLEAAIVTVTGVKFVEDGGGGGRFDVAVVRRGESNRSGSEAGGL